MYRILTLLLITGLACLAGSKPDFSGVWKLNRSDSKFPGAAPNSLVRTVEHSEPRLRYVVEREIDGQKKEQDVEVTIGAAGPDDRVAAVWEGDVLVVTLHADGDVTQVERWKLSADRRRITDETEVRRPGKDPVKLLRVFDRQ